MRRGFGGRGPLVLQRPDVCLCFRGSRVRLWSEDGPEAEVLGLDENGFLQVKSGEQGVVSVQPDGNSFDMLRNLVVIKSS